MILLISSNKDAASLNIKQQIKSHYHFEETYEEFQENPIHKAFINNREVKLITSDQELIYAQNLTDIFKNIELAVFISRHSSESGTPTLSVHTPGNLSKAEMGGLPRKISISPANAMREALKALAQFKNEFQLGYEVSYEGTHHGPSLDVPTMFIELGSSIKEWNDPKAAEAVAHATIEAVSNFDSNPAGVVVGVGGPHYSAKFTSIALDDNVAFGHIIPKYAVSNMDKGMFRQCVERTLEKVDRAVLDWKGIKGEDKPLLVEAMNEIGLSLEKV